MQRITVIGATGAGKSTLARTIAARLGCAGVELDALYWRPGWVAEDDQIFRDKVDHALSGATWAASGNYARVRDVIWSRADTLVWLDYPLSLSLARLVRRTISGLITQKEFVPGCRETIGNAVLARDSVFQFALRTHYKRRAATLASLADGRYAHLTVHRFGKPQDTAAWLAAVRI